MSNHIERIDAFLTAYNSAADEDELTRLSQEAVDEMMENRVGLEAVPHILALMERHPLASFGTLGSLVHFMEGFYGSGYDGCCSNRCAVRPRFTPHGCSIASSTAQRKPRRQSICR